MHIYKCYILKNNMHNWVVSMFKIPWHQPTATNYIFNSLVYVTTLLCDTKYTTNCNIYWINHRIVNTCTCNCWQYSAARHATINALNATKWYNIGESNRYEPTKFHNYLEMVNYCFSSTNLRGYENLKNRCSQKKSALAGMTASY